MLTLLGGHHGGQRLVAGLLHKHRGLHRPKALLLMGRNILSLTQLGRGCESLARAVERSGEASLHRKPLDDHPGIVLTLPIGSFTVKMVEDEASSLLEELIWRCLHEILKSAKNFISNNPPALSQEEPCQGLFRYY